MFVRAVCGIHVRANVLTRCLTSGQCESTYGHFHSLTKWVGGHTPQCVRVCMSYCVDVRKCVVFDVLSVVAKCKCCLVLVQYVSMCGCMT